MRVTTLQAFDDFRSSVFRGERDISFNLDISETAGLNAFFSTPAAWNGQKPKSSMSFREIGETFTEAVLTRWISIPFIIATLSIIWWRQQFCDFDRVGDKYTTLLIWSVAWYRINCVISFDLFSISVIKTELHPLKSTSCLLQLKRWTKDVLPDRPMECNYNLPLSWEMPDRFQCDKTFWVPGSCLFAM